MEHTVQLIPMETCIGVCFYIEEDIPMAIGERMEALWEDAYMNGENWAAFLTYYLETRAPELLEDMEIDAEAGMYAAYYPNTPEGTERAAALCALIRRLLANETELYQIVQEEGGCIEWD